MFADLASAIGGSHLSLEEALMLEARNLYPVMHSQGTQRGVAAFLSGKRFWFT